MTTRVRAVALAIGVAASANASAQMPAAGGQPPAASPIVLVDATGRVAAKALNDTLMLVAIAGTDISAPAFIRPVYDADGRAASGLATWQTGGSVLFMSFNCTTGAHVFSSGNPGVRATTQVETPQGIMLFVGANGTTTTVAVHSILYGNGCSAVTVQQNGLVPVEATVNLTAAYPPPLSLR